MTTNFESNEKPSPKKGLLRHLLMLLECCLFHQHLQGSSAVHVLLMLIQSFSIICNKCIQGSVQIPYRVVQRPDICIYITWGRFFWFLIWFAWLQWPPEETQYSIWDPPSNSTLVILTPFLCCVHVDQSLCMSKNSKDSGGDRNHATLPLIYVFQIVPHAKEKTF